MVNNVGVPSNLPALFQPGSNTPNLNYLQTALQSSNPVAAATAAQTVAISKETPPTGITITLYDKFYNYAGTVGDYKSLEYTFEWNAPGSAHFVMKHTDPLVNVVMNCWQFVVPVTIDSGYLRWSGRVEYVDYEFKAPENGGPAEYNITVYCMSDYQWFSKILCWPDFLLPIQIQFPSEALFLGPAISCIKVLIAEQTFRLQSGLWEFINNALSLDLNWEAWFGTVLESNGNLINMLLTPIVVVPTDPLFDTSPWTSFSGRMDQIGTLVWQVMKDNGLTLTANLWLPGDPQPQGLLVNLTQATIVVDCKNMSGVTGPTGTFIDGLIEQTVNLQNSILGNVLSPFLGANNVYAPSGVNIAPLLGVNFVAPWVLFTDQPRGGLREYHLINHAPLAFTIIGGGKSPQWVNDLINATLEYLIDAIEIAVGWTGIPSTILSGTFDDVILAFQQIENADRRITLGPYGFPEYFQQTGASAYTLDEWFALQEAMWDTRGYTGMIVNFDDGYPYTLGKDIFVGALASFAATNLANGSVAGSASTVDMNLITDYVYRITVKDTPEDRRRVTCMIGDGKSHDSPVVKMQRLINSVEKDIQVILLSPN